MNMKTICINCWEPIEAYSKEDAIIYQGIAVNKDNEWLCKLCADNWPIYRKYFMESL